ncbi:MAG: RagB/SusD family nutrient uptake outer membrane protein [Paludibacteraceae bacterium]|nr:RagB/SusD family nutrient uptake outer membrane protein [Paludibacteraceae bacterium]
MNNTINKIIGAVTISLAFTACMDLQPIDPNVVQMNDGNQQEIIDLLYNKLYVSFVQTGQQGRDGNDPDIITDNEGYSGFLRTLYVLNEFPTDAGWWTWHNDAGCSDLLNICWTPTNPFVAKLYNRLNYAVTMSNHYLDLTEGVTDREAVARRAEVRFIRALNYYHLLDMFGNVPFTVTMSTDDPYQIDRESLYRWLIDEITTGHSGQTYYTYSDHQAVPSYKVTADANHGFMGDLYKHGETTIYRATQEAAKMLLARLYLNAEVYTGKAAWADAEKVAKEIVEAMPTLHQPFAEIFMGDNDKKAAEEMIFLANADGTYNSGYAGAHYAVCSPRNGNMIEAGTSDATWGCWRSSPELVKVFFPGKTPAQIIALGGGKDEFHMPVVAKDDRAMFCGGNTYVNANTGETAFNVKGFRGDVPANGEGFDSCWAICKWTNLYSSQFKVNAEGVYEIDPTASKPQHDPKWCDVDAPLMRTAEAYMTLAEALFRQGRTQDALLYINKVRARSRATALETLTEDEILAEWLREFYHEGRRRIDLVRFGQLVGPTAKMTWEGRSGSNTKKVKSYDNVNAWNTEVVSIDAHYNLYPIPETDVVANPHVKQNPGY